MLFCSVCFQSFERWVHLAREERELIFVLFRTFVRPSLVWFCLFPLPIGVLEGLRLVILAFPALFLLPFLPSSVSINQNSR